MTTENPHDDDMEEFRASDPLAYAIIRLGEDFILFFVLIFVIGIIAFFIWH